MLKARAFIAAGLLALLSSGPAIACSYDGNEYELWQREPIEELVARSAMIERVRVEHPTEPPCEDEPARGATQAERDAWYNRLSPLCWTHGIPGIPLEGTVVERFVGEGPSRIALAWRGYDGDDWYFSDLAQVYENDRTYVLGYDAERYDLHSRRAFWMDHGIEYPLDGSDSCGGFPTLIPGNEYVLFRDEGGATIAAEPISGADDALVQWLRLPVDSEARLRATLFTPQEAFEAASGLVEVSVTRCERTTSEYAQWPYDVFGLQRRGTRRSHSRDEVQPDEETELFLSAWFIWRDLPCGPVDLLLVDTLGGGDYLPEMPAVITDGTVSVAELFPGVRLTGPERVTVDQAFEWFKAGRAED